MIVIKGLSVVKGLTGDEHFQHGFCVINYATLAMSRKAWLHLKIQRVTA